MNANEEEDRNIETFQKRWQHNTEYRWIEIKAIHDQKNENYVILKTNKYIKNNNKFH